jgi:hypothetical protein
MQCNALLPSRFHQAVPTAYEIAFVTKHCLSRVSGLRDQVQVTGDREPG